MEKYHIITESWDNGEDDKQDANTLKEAVKLAKEWLKKEYYHSVKIFSNGQIKRHYIRIGKRVKQIA